ncbi:alkylglycerol monooxygenase-like [Portunus trituberculatus]|uniref:alkylglycerol monooxygenase-like n=1 Tax=Portunus trituberculatus TaxID=210409 RepID=UPI001E1CCFC6|nr:alkylglycerol monooxygenase-like [Portunus trituberculatus]
MEVVMRRLGSLLYLVEPNATTFQYPDQVPDYVTEAIPLFVIITALEFAVLWWQGRPERVNDAFSNIGIGIVHEATRLVVSGLMLLGYETLYQYRLWDLPWDSHYTWVAALIFVDFCFYWVHRANHELNILWAVHQVHHSSENYNLTTGFRLSALQKLAHFGFYQPLALLGIPLPAVLVHTGLNYLFQFWIHNTFIGRLGPLEYVIATPSFHRVHHGANKWCLDKNYASVLVLWDILFGTFQPEKEDSEIVYGLTHQPQSFNAIWHQLYYFDEVFRKARSMTTWRNSLKAVFYGPGWSPGTPRLGNPDLFPDVVAPRQKYNPQLPSWKLWYIGSHLAVALFIQQLLVARILTASWITIIIFLAFIFASVGVVTAMLDGWRWTGLAEAVRCIAYVLNARSSLTTDFPSLDIALEFYFAVCAVFWTCHSLAPNIVVINKEKLS